MELRLSLSGMVLSLKGFNLKFLEEVKPDYVAIQSVSPPNKEIIKPVFSNPVPGGTPPVHIWHVSFI